MNPAGIPLFDLADRKLAWLDQRQATLSRNVANVDTPRYRARDVLPFGQALARAGFDLAPARTDPLHLAGTLVTAPGTTALPGTQAPDGNAVSLDDQLERLADTDSAHQIVSDLYRKYLGMFRTALGR